MDFLQYIWVEFLISNWALTEAHKRVVEVASTEFGILRLTNLEKKLALEIFRGFGNWYYNGRWKSQLITTGKNHSWNFRQIRGGRGNRRARKPGMYSDFLKPPGLRRKGTLSLEETPSVMKTEPWKVDVQAVIIRYVAVGKTPPSLHTNQSQSTNHQGMRNRSHMPHPRRHQRLAIDRHSERTSNSTNNVNGTNASSNTDGQHHEYSLITPHFEYTNFTHLSLFSRSAVSLPKEMYMHVSSL
ncbi:hypothetical protein Tco_0947523 [Tanacetum coccineum]